MKYFLFIPAFISLTFPLLSQETLLLQYSNSITREELSEHVYTLASEKFDGRYTGSEGQRMAAEYIQKEFREDGLKAPGLGSSMPYFQEFALDKCYWKEQSLSAGDVKFTAGEQFVFLTEPKDLGGDYPVVFTGFGIDDPLYSDYTDLDVNGKVVLAFSGEPKGKDGKYLISGKEDPSRKAYYWSKSVTAKQMGAIGLIVMARDEKDFRKYAKHYDEMVSRPETSYRGDKDPTDIFSVYIPAVSGGPMLGKSGEDMESMAESDEAITLNAGKLSGTVGIGARRECFPMNTENVIGIVEGSDKKGEAVVVVAHYDHVGQQDGKIYYGADDNATGTAAVMEIAEAFAKAAEDGHRPARTVIFMAVTAEELGLYGSRYYTEHPVISLDSTYACVNIDMIGRTWTRLRDEPNYIGGYVYSSMDLFTLVQEQIRLSAPGLKDRMEYSQGLRGGSDHYHFSEKGVPSIFYFTGIHKDYHEPSDTPDKILYDRMETTVRTIFATAWALANRKEALIIDR